MAKTPTLTLDPRTITARDAESRLVEALRGQKGQLTRADAAVATGLGPEAAGEALERLMRSYPARLAVTERGELLYRFHPAMRRRNEPTLAERTRAAGRAAVRLVVRAFKLLIALTLLVYFVVFALLALAAIVGLRAGRDGDGNGDGFGGGWGGGWDRDGHGPGGHGHGGLLPRFFIFFWPGPGPVVVDPWGRSLPVARRREPRPRKRFLFSVYDFVFGPAQPRPDPLAEEREVLALVRAQGGRLTASDLVALFGWSFERADAELTRLMSAYDGEPVVTEDGVIVYIFPSLMPSAGELPAGRWRYAWQRPETAPPLTGNSTGANVAIGAFAAFNLLASFFAAGWATQALGVSGRGWTFALHTYPLVFFVAFLAIPVVRAVARALGERGRARRNRTRALLARVFAAGGGPLPHTPELLALLRDYDGRVELEDTGRVQLVFPRIASEQRALAGDAALAELRGAGELGAIVFDTEDGHEEPAGALPPPEPRPLRQW